MSATTETRPPDLRLVFKEGDYSHALRCYERARQWLLCGNVMLSLLRLEALINGPIYQGRQPEKVIPLEWTAATGGWSVTVDFWILDGTARGFLLRVAPPEGAEWEADTSVSDREIKAAFHLLWTKAAYQDGYVKAEWSNLRDALISRGITV